MRREEKYVGTSETGDRSPRNKKDVGDGVRTDLMKKGLLKEEVNDWATWR